MAINFLRNPGKDSLREAIGHLESMCFLGEVSIYRTPLTEFSRSAYAIFHLTHLPTIQYQVLFHPKIIVIMIIIIIIIIIIIRLTNF